MAKRFAIPQIQAAHAKELSTEALLAAFLFAAHPVHTEAVAGIVGHAELLCAALVVAALLGYMRAVDGSSAEGSPAQWQLVAAALALVLLAAFAKEIGITTVSSTLACLRPMPPECALIVLPSKQIRPATVDHNWEQCWQAVYVMLRYLTLVCRTGLQHT